MRNRLPDLLPAHKKRPTCEVIIEPTLEGACLELLKQSGLGGKSVLIVSDPASHKALGARVEAELAGLKPATLKLPEGAHADESLVARIRAVPSEAIIAVGSGTINDLCKYASFLDKKEYVVFATAPSMNGYLSANASITLAGQKTTLAAHLPRGVFCDLGVLAAAPNRLIRSGLGDSLCRPTAQADWLLSHLVMGTPYSSEPFDLLAPYEKELFSHAGKLVKGDKAIIELLTRTLIVSGLGMFLSGGSYPASQGEHMIAHTMEMKHGAQLPPTFHGEQIGVTTLTMARLQHALLEKPLNVRRDKTDMPAMERYFGADLAPALMKASHAKFDAYELAAFRVASMEKIIRAAIKEVLLPEPTLRKVLEDAGAPVHPDALGWKEGDYLQAITHARFTRDRFTFLDLA